MAYEDIDSSLSYGRLPFRSRSSEAFQQGLRSIERVDYLIKAIVDNEGGTKKDVIVTHRHKPDLPFFWQP